MTERPIFATDGYCYYCIMPDGPNRNINQEDVRLINAAPDLLAALKAVVRIAGRKTVEFDAARAAISKATGQSA